MQFEIFRKLYLSDNQNAVCYLIGDPKQSIYKFRNSDINSYRMAKQRILEINGGNDGIYTLDTNYRSANLVVEAVNRFFEETDGSTYVDKPFSYDRITRKYGHN